MFSSKASNSVICAKFRRISSQHDDFPDEQRYHREGPWKLYKWNLGHCPKTLRFLLGNPNQVFSTTKTDSIICANFQVISWQYSNFQKFRHIKEVVKCEKHRPTLGTFPQCIISGQNLVYLSKASDSKIFVQSFEGSQFNMMTFQISKGTTEKALESYISEI